MYMEQFVFLVEAYEERSVQSLSSSWRPTRGEKRLSNTRNRRTSSCTPAERRARGGGRPDGQQKHSRFYPWIISAEPTLCLLRKKHFSRVNQASICHQPCGRQVNNPQLHSLAYCILHVTSCLHVTPVGSDGPVPGKVLIRHLRKEKEK